MIWFYAEDSYYYRNIEELKRNYNLDDIVIFPTDEEMREIVRRDKCACIASYDPPKKFRSLFVKINLPNKYGILTTQEHEAGVSEDVALEKRLGINVIKPNVTLKDVAGADQLKRWTYYYLKAEEKGYRAKGVFLVGVPGTGKTFYPMCFAGETGRLVIMLNLPQLMEKDNPVESLNRVFEYLTMRHKEHKDERYVILMDEIEKMIGGEGVEKYMMNRLLTILNNMHTKNSEYDIDALFFATANRLSNILENYSELLRRGRWDELFFVNLPTEKDARDLFNLYIEKFELQEILEIMSIEDIMIEIDEVYSSTNNQTDRYPYTAAEIEQFCKRLKFIQLAKENITKDDIIENIHMIMPITATATTGIDRIAAQRKLFVEV